MKKKGKLLLISLFTVLFIVSSVNVIFALSTADAKETIDVSKKCSLTLTYAAEGKKIEGLEIEVFQAADVTADYQYSMTGAFSDYPIEINGIKSQTEWDEVKDTVTAYIAADKIEPMNTQITDENGIVKFENLPVGIYYVRWTQNETAAKVQGFAPFLIAVPGLGEDGKWIYDVEALPKPGSLPEPHYYGVTIVKLWNDGARSENRPKKITVDVFRNGEFYRSVELNAENNWSCIVEADEESSWFAVERDVPDGYTVSVLNTDGRTIQIINTVKDEPLDPPDTGDSTHVYFWIVLMALSGILLIVLSSRRRKADED